MVNFSENEIRMKLIAFRQERTVCIDVNLMNTDKSPIDSAIT